LLPEVLALVALISLIALRASPLVALLLSLLLLDRFLLSLLERGAVGGDLPLALHFKGRFPTLDSRFARGDRGLALGLLVGHGVLSAACPLDGSLRGGPTPGFPCPAAGWRAS